jgi:hypothetical protein
MWQPARIQAQGLFHPVYQVCHAKDISRSICDASCFCIGRTQDNLWIHVNATDECDVPHSIPDSVARSALAAAYVGEWDDKNGTFPCIFAMLLVTNAGWKSTAPDINRSLPQVFRTRKLELHRSQLEVAVGFEANTQAGRKNIGDATDKRQSLTESPRALICLVQANRVVINDVVC